MLETEKLSDILLICLCTMSFKTNPRGEHMKYVLQVVIDGATLHISNKYCIVSDETIIRRHVKF
jgi:hypothetical protein